LARLAGIEFDESAEAEAQAADRFCSVVAHGVAAFEAITQQRRTRRWCYFAMDEVRRLLPGILIPDRLRRLHYLVRLYKTGPKIRALEFFSVRLRPLFRVLLTARPSLPG
jgi:hypothetical protein